MLNMRNVHYTVITKMRLIQMSLELQAEFRHKEQTQSDRVLAKKHLTDSDIKLVKFKPTRYIITVPKLTETVKLPLPYQLM